MAVADNPYIANIQKTLKELNKKFGDGSVQMLGANFNDYSIEVVSTGSLLLDLALGRGGLPIGRTVEVYGNEGSGKTTVALFHIAQVQKTGRLAAYIDAEHALDPELARAYGVNVDELIINQPSSGEEALDIVEALAKTGEFGIVVVDSVSSLLPIAEAEADMSQQSIGLQARMMSKALRKITSAASEGNCTVIFINQIREKIVAYGDPSTTSGGRALKYYSSIRIQVSQEGGVEGRIKDAASNIIGHRIKCRVVKNKVAVPYKEASFNLYYGKGIDTPGEIADAAIVTGIIKQAGSWFSYEEEGAPLHFKAQGKDSVREVLRGNEEVCMAITNLLRAV